MRVRLALPHPTDQQARHYVDTEARTLIPRDIILTV